MITIDIPVNWWIGGIAAWLVCGCLTVAGICLYAERWDPDGPSTFVRADELRDWGAWGFLAVLVAAWPSIIAITVQHHITATRRIKLERVTRMIQRATHSDDLTGPGAKVR
jgi:hypothetical protein